MRRENNKKEYIKEKKLEFSNSFVVFKEQLLLDFLLTHIKNQSRNNIKTILKNKCVLVDGVVTTQFDYLLSNKQVVQISKSPVIKTSDNKSYKLDIIYEDEEFVVINKPAGLLSIATDKELNNTAYHYVLEYVRSKDKKNQIYIVHRLDKETSGVLMFAKNRSIRDTLQDSWNELVKIREYYAVVNGRMDKKEDTLRNYLAETKTHLVFVSDSKNDKLAITNYKVIKESKDKSLLQVLIDSGRKNQIRVQLAHISHYVIGDDKYGDKKDKRLYLHASSLSFTHPLNKKTYTFTAKIPNEFYSKVQ